MKRLLTLFGLIIAFLLAGCTPRNHTHYPDQHLHTLIYLRPNANQPEITYPPPNPSNPPRSSFGHGGNSHSNHHPYIYPHSDAHSGAGQCERAA